MPEIKRVTFPWIPESKKQSKGAWNTDPRYHTHKWRKYRKSFFAKKENKLCIECRKAGKLTKADTIGHIISVKDDPSDENFWNPNNHKPLCKSCNIRDARK